MRLTDICMPWEKAWLLKSLLVTSSDLGQHVAQCPGLSKALALLFGTAWRI